MSDSLKTFLQKLWAILTAIFTNSQVWSAIINFTYVILFFACPTFPKEVWAAINFLWGSILVALGINVAIPKGKANLKGLRERQMIDQAAKALALHDDLTTL